MALTIGFAAETGKTLFASIERLSDGFFWDETTDEAWESAPSVADKKIPLTEGTGENAGSYIGSNSGDLGDAGLCRVRTHDDADSDKVIGMEEVYIQGGNEVSGLAPDVLQSTTIATLASQTSGTLTTGSTDNDAYNGCLAIITDQSTSTQKAVAYISDYVGGTKTFTLLSAPAFTIAVGDTIDIVAVDSILAQAIDSQLDSIQGKANLIGAGSVEVSAPVATGGLIEIIRDRDYATADGFELAWTVSTDDTFPDLTGATVTFALENPADESQVLSVAGTVVTATGTQKVSVDLADTDTTSIKPGTYHYEVLITYGNGRKVPFAHVENGCTVKDDYV